MKISSRFSEVFALYLLGSKIVRIMGVEHWAVGGGVDRGFRVKQAILTQLLCTGDSTVFLDKALWLYKSILCFKKVMGSG